MTVVLGGGISGLSAAYYALSKPQLGPLTLLEASNRLGGWIRSHELPNGLIFEKGPRIIRCIGPAGKNTLNLLEDLELANKIIPITGSHPSVKSRILYAQNKLHLLPNNLTSFLNAPPLISISLKSFLKKDLLTPRVHKDDESLYDFTERKFGKNAADYLFSAIICGICAGNAKDISVNFLMRKAFEREQKYGSIIKGMIIEFLKEKFFNSNNSDLVLSNLAKQATSEGWVNWGLKGGLEQFPRTLGRNLHNQGVDIQLNSHCEKLVFNSDHVELIVNGEVRKCSRVISSLPAKALAKLIEEQHPQLATQLNGIPMVTVAVINLQFSDNILPTDAFGFLVPPKEQSPILGVIFDSCVFPQESSTVCKKCKYFIYIYISIFNLFVRVF